MKSNRILIIALLISVAANLVAVGYLTGRAVQPKPLMTRMDPVMGVRHLVGDLPAERARSLAPYYRDYFAALRPRLHEVRDAQTALRAAMQSEPLDVAALRQALVAFNSHFFETQEDAHQALVELAKALTLAERQALVSYLSERPRRHQRPAFQPSRKPETGRPPISPDTRSQ